MCQGKKCLLRLPVGDKTNTTRIFWSCVTDMPLFVIVRKVQEVKYGHLYHLSTEREMKRWCTSLKRPEWLQNTEHVKILCKHSVLLNEEQQILLKRCICMNLVNKKLSQINLCQCSLVLSVLRWAQLGSALWADQARLGVTTAAVSAPWSASAPARPGRLLLLSTTI